jgi:peptidoglycan/LPS O-acetylase OafA/YrhL
MSTLNRGAFRFALGLIFGVIFSTALVAVSSGSSPYSTWILAGMTYLSFILLAVGYLVRSRNTQLPINGDFLLGLGVGLVLVWFVMAGQDLIGNV